MANAAVTFDGTRVNAADVVGTVWVGIGGGGTKAVAEPDFVYQGVGSISSKIGTTLRGPGLDTVATIDYTTPKVWIAKVIATNSSVLLSQASPGGVLEIGSGGARSAYDQYYVVGNDNYPISGGWLIIPIDPNGGNQSNRPGTAPTLTAIDYYAWVCDFSTTSKSENVAIDAVDHIDHGTGLTCLDGIGGTDGNFALFATTDEDAAASNRWGIVSTRNGILFVTGVLTVGDSGTGAEFTSVGEVVVWPDAEFLNSPGFFGLDLNLENSSTVISLTNGTFISRGTSGGTVDTRAVVEFIGTTATVDAEVTGCNFQNLADFITTSKVHVNTSTIETVNLTQGTAHIENTTIVTNPATSVACITDPTFAATTDLHDIDFVFGSGGHALELSGVGATVTLTNITFTGYGADTTDSAAIDVTAATGTTTINWSGGTAPTYKTAGATVVVQNTVTVGVTVLDSADSTPISGARVLIKANGVGDLPVNDSVTISRVTTTATVAHTAHGMTSGQKVEIRNAVPTEYNGVFAISNVSANAYDYTMLSDPGVAESGSPVATGVLLEGTTNGSGVLQNTGFPFTDDQPFLGRSRKGTTSPFYQTQNFSGTLTDAGLSINVTMVSDE